MSRDRVVGRGHPKPHIWNQRPQFAYSLYNFYGATTTIKGSLRGSTTIVNSNNPIFIAPYASYRGFSRKFSKSRQKRAQKWRFRELRGVNVKCLFSNPEKAHPCAEPRRLTYYA